MRQRLALGEEPSQFELEGAALAAMLAGRSDFRGTLLQAQYHQYQENWEGAIEYYKLAFMKSMEQSVSDQRQLIMGLSRCFYEIGKYDRAIQLGESAIAMNRHFPQIHKYVALA